MSEDPDVEISTLRLRVRVGSKDRVYWDAEWRWRRPGEPLWRTRKRRLGLAWQEPDGEGRWRKRRGRCQPGWLDEPAAHVAAAGAVDEFKAELAAEQEAERKALLARTTVRVLAGEWIEWLRDVRGAKPSTVKDYHYLLREPGTAHLRGGRVAEGRILRAFGDVQCDEVTTADVSAFLRQLDRAGLTPRNVNKHRQALAAVFKYACRADTYALPVNPVTGTDKRREDPPPALDYYEVHEVEALARACERGEQRVGRAIFDPDELAAREHEDRQDADAFRLLFYTGLRVGELLTLRWEDVDLGDRMLLVRRGLSAGVESTPKGRRHRFVPLSAPAVSALARLSARDEFVEPDDYVLANRHGRRLETTALRVRYRRGCEAAGLRPVKLHGLRHAAGSLIARTNDPVFVRDFLGHAKLSTTDRNVSAKLRPEEFERLDRAFEVADLPSGDSPRTEQQ